MGIALIISTKKRSRLLLSNADHDRRKLIHIESGIKVLAVCVSPVQVEFSALSNFHMKNINRCYDSPAKETFDMVRDSETL